VRNSEWEVIWGEQTVGSQGESWTELKGDLTPFPANMLASPSLKTDLLKECLVWIIGCDERNPV
jgi:hypothetical protein